MVSIFTYMHHNLNVVLILNNIKKKIEEIRIMIFSFIIKRHTIYLILRNYMQITIQIKKTIAIIDILIITHGM